MVKLVFRLIACFFVFFLLFSCAGKISNKTEEPSAITSASHIVNNTGLDGLRENVMDTQNIIILFSPNGSTKKIAEAISNNINASIFNLDGSKSMPDGINDYHLIGFGSGIFHDKHHSLLLEFAENLPEVRQKNAFIFSTCGVFTEEYMNNNHKTLRDILVNKGFLILGEYSCPGFNKNSFLKLFGGINKNRPNADDIIKAISFSEELLQ
ncbi:MAG: flavodoxin [Treponema sp.]|nr:flavodoxin [Treponema sp.]